jgi:hypothetical protein
VPNDIVTASRVGVKPGMRHLSVRSRAPGGELVRPVDKLPRPGAC